jgi:hypothetical protein
MSPKYGSDTESEGGTGNGGDVAEGGSGMVGDSGIIYGTDQQLMREKRDVTKQITSFTVQDINRDIKPGGDIRKIIIRGTPNSMFSLTIKDSLGCSILEDIIKNVTMSDGGKYELYQDFPSILTDEGAEKSKETYDITLTPAADVILSAEIGIQSPTIRLYQYADPIITITNTTSQSDSTVSLVGLTVTGDDITKTGPAKSFSEGITPAEYALTIVENPTDYAGSLYVKDSSFNNNITSSTLIKKVVDRGGETGLTGILNLDPLTTRTESTIESDGDYKIDGVVQSNATRATGDLEAGMGMYAKVEHSKSVVASLDEDDNILDYGKCSKKTNKFTLENTHDLFVGMIVSAVGVFDTEIQSIDCDKNITLTKKQIIKKDTVLTFKREWWSGVAEVRSNITAQGKACITLTRPVDIPDNTEIHFDDNGHIIRGSTTYNTSGGNSITLTTRVDFVRFGTKNTTYTLDLDNMITNKPNAYDQNVSVKKNSSGIAIDMIRYDNDANASSKTGTVVRSPRHGTVSAYATSTDTFRYIPNTSFVGEDSFTFTMSDGTKSSDEKTVRIIVK